MLFRTKFLIAVIALGAVAIGSASLLIVSARENELNQQRTNLAHESLSGYFQLSGAVFRAFKQTRRDLLSGPGQFDFDFAQSAQDIATMLDEIEDTLIAESVLTPEFQNRDALANLAVLRSEVMQALNDIQAASDMIVAGQSKQGRQRVSEILQGQVDVKIVALIEEATNVERSELARAQQEIRDVQKAAETTAWIAATLAALLSFVIFLTLLRRFQTGLRALGAGAQAYTANNLDYVIDLPGGDELSAVAYGFNTMASQMQIKQNALETARQQLEMRVTERTAALSAANAELRESDALRRQFFAEISHELRTPVSAIRGEAEVALRAKTGRAEAREAALKTIIAISDELTADVSDLFLIAREMAGVLDFRTNPIDLNHAVSLGIEQIQSLSGQKNAVISKHLPMGKLIISGDTSRISQLVRILISNALEHAPHAVKITISVLMEGETAVLSVADDGPGILEKDWPRIFDRFVKGSNRPSGTGLGLAIAKSIVMAHGGTISVQHGPHGGAEFLARFPSPKERARE